MRVSQLDFLSFEVVDRIVVGQETGTESEITSFLRFSRLDEEQAFAITLTTTDLFKIRFRFNMEDSIVVNNRFLSRINNQGQTNRNIRRSTARAIANIVTRLISSATIVRENLSV